MRRLLPYYRKYIWHIIGAALLLFVMSNADLSLPDYLSQIVNIGIQQNGIETGAPEVLRGSTIDELSKLQPQADHQQLISFYHVLDPASAEAQRLKETYPGSAGQQVYVRNSSTAEDAAAIEALAGKPLVLVYGMQMMEANPALAGTIFGADAAARMAQLPAGMTPSQVLASMPAAAREELVQKANRQLDTLEGTMLHGMTVRAVAAEYEALGMDIQRTQTGYIVSVGRVMVLLALIAAITSILVSFLASKAAAGIAHDLRSAVFNKVQQFSSQEFNQFSTASLITRTTNDVMQIQQLTFMTMRMALSAPLIATVGIIRALNKSPNMWWLIALAVSLIVLLIAVSFAVAVPKFKLMQKLVDKLNLVTRENLSGMLVVRAFNKQQFEEARFDQANTDLTGTMLYIGRVMVTLFPFMSLVMTGLNVLIIWVGSHEVAASVIQVGDMMAFMQYALMIMFAFLNLSMLFIMFPRAAVSADRIADVLETEFRIQDPAEPVRLSQPVKGELEFRDVDFAYSGAEEEVLHDITFKASPGEITAVIGSTGSGKSTLVNLIPRLFDVTGGSIHLDGVDIRKLTQQELREAIGFVPQRSLLFSGTVVSNLQVGLPGASEEQMKQALIEARAADFVFEREEGLETTVSQGGTNLSGGQKQRLAIARALIKDAPVLVFDDSFSALDYKTDAELRAGLREKLTDRTVIIVTQRIATAKTADQILVLDDGRLVGLGKHADLLKSCKTYYEIATSQLSEEELA